MKKLIVILCLLFSANMIAQGEANIWYFGENAGLDFSNCTPVPLTDGMLNTREGCSAISNALGELLFYSDGSTVWNKNHQRMASNLKGDASSTQSALIIPHPANFNQYFLFVVGASSSNNASFNYYTIDMSENNGLGALIDGPVNLAEGRGSVWSEKVAAVRGDNIRTSWVVSYVENEFYAYKVSVAGVANYAVKSEVNFTATDVRGYLKISPNGKKIAIAHQGDGAAFIYDFDDATGRISNEASLPFSGTAKNPYGIEFSADSKKLYVNATNAVGGENPSDNYTTLYQYDLTTTSTVPPSTVIDSRNSYRGALQLGPDRKIYRARSSTYDLGTAFLGVINNPEALGTACNYQHSGISLGNNSTQGLPPFSASIFSQIQIKSVDANNEETIINNVVLDLCEGEEVTIRTQVISDDATYQWFHNRAVISTDPFITINSASPTDYGDYKLKMIYFDNCGNSRSLEGEFSIYIHQAPNVVPEVYLNTCDVDGVLDNFTDFNLELANNYFLDAPIFGKPLISSYYLTLEDAESGTDPIDTSVPFNSATQNPVFVRVEDLNNCGFYDTSILNLVVSTKALPEDFIVTLEVCDDDIENDGLHTFNLFEIWDEILAEFPDEDYLTIQYYRNELDAQLDQNRITPAGSYISQTPFFQAIYVRLSNAAGDCFGVGPHVNLIVNLIPEFELEEEIYLCTSTSQSITINTFDANGDYTYTWTNEAGTTIGNDPSLIISEEGTYTVTAESDEECLSSSKSTTVLNVPDAQIDLSNITIVEENDGNTVTIISLNDGLDFDDYEYAIDNATGVFQDEPIFKMVTAGVHYIYIRNKLGCNITSFEISILGFPHFFTPNNDGYNDYWNIIGSNGDSNASSNVYIYDRFGKVVTKLDLSSDGWDGTFSGKELPSSDYWFSGSVIDSFGEEQTINGHFSLIRR